MNMESRKPNEVRKGRKGAFHRAAPVRSSQAVAPSAPQTHHANLSHRQAFEAPTNVLRYVSNDGQSAAPRATSGHVVPTANVYGTGAVNGTAVGESAEGFHGGRRYVDDSQTSYIHSDDPFGWNPVLAALHRAEPRPVQHAGIAASDQYMYRATLDFEIGADAEAEAQANAEAEDDLAAYNAAIARGVDPRYATLQGVSDEERNALAMKSYR